MLEDDKSRLFVVRMSPRDRQAALATNAWRRGKRDAGLVCVQCERPFADGSIDVEVQGVRVPGKCYNFLFWNSIALVHGSLLDAVRKYGEPGGCCLGRVTNEKGQLLKTWSSVWMRTRHDDVVLYDVQGQPGGNCPRCGRPFSPLRTDVSDAYTIPQMPVGNGVWLAGSTTVLLRGDVAVELTQASMDGIELEEVHIGRLPREGAVSA